MTGVIDRYAVISDHLHYNPSFDTDNESERISRAQERASLHGPANGGYLDILHSPKEERERSESRMAEETVPTSEIVFETGGKGADTDKASDFKFEPAGVDSPHSTARRESKTAKDKPIDLRTGTGSRLCGCGCDGCGCGCSKPCRWRAVAAAVVVLGAALVVVVLLVVGVLSF